MHNRVIPALVLGGLCAAHAANAYEYTLQFSAAGNIASRRIAGYAFVGNTVTGDCTYTLDGACSGRGCHPNYTTYYQGCTWDLYGNLLGVTPGEPPAPAPLSTTGGVIVYARNSEGGTTGVDTTRGNLPFVNTISAQYTWVSPPSVVFSPGDRAYVIKFRVQSIGDVPLVVTSVLTTASLGQLSFKSANCTLSGIAVGRFCTLALKYDPTKIPRGDNPYTAYDRITVQLQSNSGLVPITAAIVETAIPPGDG